MSICGKSVSLAIRVELSVFVATVVAAINDYALALRNMKAAIGTTHHDFGAVGTPFFARTGIRAFPAQPPIDGNTQ
jgi:hypothetical protein